MGRPTPRRVCLPASPLRPRRRASAWTGSTRLFSPGRRVGFFAAPFRAGPGPAPASAVSPLWALATTAAPSATACFGWASTTTGRPVASRTSRGRAGSATTHRPAARARRRRGRSRRSRSHARAPRPSPRSGADHGLELPPGQPHLGGRPGEQDRDRDVDVVRERLLGGAALGRSRASAVAATGSPGSSADTAPPTASSTCASTAWSTSTPPRRSMPSGVPSTRNPAGSARSDGGVERPAAEVVHGEDLTRLDPLRRRMVPRRRLGLCDQPDVG